MVKRIFWLSCFLAIVYSCSTDNDLSSVSIGKDFLKTQTSITMIDTFSVNLSTLVIDSIPTSESAALLVGQYTDSYFGKVKSTGYFQVGLSDSIETEDKAVFDSITLSLRFNGDWYGDTLAPQTINVYRLLEDIVLNDDSKLYNSSSFKYSETPIGSVTVVPKPSLYEHLEIKLSDGLGEEFVRLMKGKTDEVSSSEKFIDYFKGIALSQGVANSSVLGFEAVDSSLYLTLYMHYIGETKVEHTYIFPLHLETTCFNKIETDRSGTYVENLKTQKGELPSSETGDRAFLEAGSGIVTRLDFPSLSRLLEFNIRSYLYKAEVILKPYPNSYSEVGLPNNIVLYKTDKYNRLVSEIVSSDGSSLFADFYYDGLYNENTYYQFDVTDFITSKLQYSYFDTDAGLIITLPEEKFKGSLDRMVFDARKNALFRPVLRLYFVFYN